MKSGIVLFISVNFLQVWLKEKWPRCSETSVHSGRDAQLFGFSQTNAVFCKVHTWDLHSQLHKTGVGRWGGAHNILSPSFFFFTFVLGHIYRCSRIHAACGLQRWALENVCEGECSYISATKSWWIMGRPTGPWLPQLTCHPSDAGILQNGVLSRRTDASFASPSTWHRRETQCL